MRLDPERVHQRVFILSIASMETLCSLSLGRRFYVASKDDDAVDFRTYILMSSSIKCAISRLTFLQLFSASLTSGCGLSVKVSMQFCFSQAVLRAICHELKFAYLSSSLDISL